MTDRDAGALERAENLLKKVLGRVGSTVDERIASGNTRLTAHEVGSLAASLVASIEAEVRADARGVRRLAPDLFDVSLTYEQNSRYSDSEREALAAELAAIAYEHVVNHRYETRTKVRVEVGSDLFARKSHVTARFSAEAGDAGAVHDVRTNTGGEVRRARSSESAYQLVGPGGKPVVRVELAPGGEAVRVGRSAGNRLVIDHASVSKVHATVALTRDNRLVVADLDSTNGTFVNAETTPISGARAIVPGDTIVFGDVAFVIQKL